MLWGKYAALLLLVAMGCRKKFDEPPVYTGADIQATLSIQDLRLRHQINGYEYITDDYVIEGIVVADDRTDNFYKSIVLQDSTGGITIRMDGYGLYNDYPAGSRIAVKLKELWMGDYGRMIQLGAGVDRSDPASPELLAIPAPLFGRFLVKKSANNPVVPRQVRLDELGDSLQSCLIMIDHLEFAVSDTGKTYADAVNKLSANKTVKACSGGSVYLRTSGFARFASAKVPRGNGRITAVYSVFRNDKQLVIRDTADIRMDGLRCTGAGSKLLFSEDFEMALPDTDLLLKGWKNLSETGHTLFRAKTGSVNTYAEISAFATGQASSISWLVMPPVNLSNSANEVLSFQTKDGFDNGAVLQVLVSTNYDGGNTPWKARWTPLKATMAKGSNTAIAGSWTGSGPVSLAGFRGLVSIAFRYEGADPAAMADKRTTSFQLDNIRVEGN